MLSLSEGYSLLKSKGFFKKVRERVCIDLALESIEEQVKRESSSLTFVQLPPGYGKTAIPYSLWAWSLLHENMSVDRSIHVLPLRSIVEDCWERFVDGLKALGLSQSEAVGVAGAECMFTHYSPFLLKSFVVTTIDTFALLAAKLPPSEIERIAHERGFGHYEIARGALLSSIVTFDEAHLLLDEGSKDHGRTLTALLALIRALVRWRVPIIFMTATLPRSWRRSLEKWLRDREQTVEVKDVSYGEGGLKDEEFESEVKSVKLNTDKPLCKDDASYINGIAEAASTYERVLVVTNTIKRAQKLYDELRKRGLNPLLLHSKFTQGDREGKLNTLKGDKWLCVSTQVVEAGVDISANVLYTDIAPLCAMVQRAGRCCRPSHVSGGEDGKVVICISDDAISSAKGLYHPCAIEASKEALEKVDRDFNWHLYSDYMRLLEGYGGGYGLYSVEAIEKKVDSHQLISMLKLLLMPYYASGDAFNLLLQLGSFTRDKPLVTGVVCEVEGVDWKNYEKLIPLRIPLEHSDIEHIKHIAKESGTKLEVIESDEEGQLRPSKRDDIRHKEVLSGTVVAVLVPPKLYDRERGLLIWNC